MKLTSVEIEDRLVGLDGWTVVDDRLHKEFTFVDFKEAFGFMIAVAEAAERLDHHPDWSNSWNQVVIDIASHAAGGITAKCFLLAQAVELVVDGDRSLAWPGNPTGEETPSS